MIRLILFYLLLTSMHLLAQVKVGVDVFFEEGYDRSLLKGKRIGLITNQTAIDQQSRLTIDRFLNCKECKTVAVFAPEHGFYGASYAYEKIDDGVHNGIPVYSLYGSRRRPTEEQLKDIDILIFDVQDIGTRSYTFCSTLFYCMEEAAKRDIKFIVLDRPNPQGGMVVDGPLIDESCRSYLGYVNVPYCHGMTIGELACLFNKENKVNCHLTIIPMKGWKRGMCFAQTGLRWVPTSPQIPEADTPLYYPLTGILGQYANVNIGVGYTLPFKVVGAPWIDPKHFSAACNGLKLPGVYFQPFYFRPFFGLYKHETCKGVLVVVTDTNNYLPVTTGYAILGVLKNLYPHQFEDGMRNILSSKSHKDTCFKIAGRQEILSILHQEKYVIWKLREICHEDAKSFLPIRKKYLIQDYF